MYALQFIHALEHSQGAACRARPAEYRIELGEAMVAGIAIGRCLNLLLQQAVQLDALIDAIQIVEGPKRVINAAVQCFASDRVVVVAFVVVVLAHCGSCCARFACGRVKLAY